MIILGVTKLFKIKNLKNLSLFMYCFHPHAVVALSLGIYSNPNPYTTKNHRL